MSVAIVGGTGFIGKYIAAQFNKPYLLSRSSKKAIPNTTYVPFDITKPIPAAVYNTCKDVNTIINCTGIMHERGDNTFFNVHINGALHVREFAEKLGSRLVHLSAIGADPLSDIPYSKTKGIGEEIILEYKNSVVVRPSIVFGREDEFFNVLL
jgi:NADH dehydrogenase